MNTIFVERLNIMVKVIAHSSGTASDDDGDSVRPLKWPHIHSGSQINACNKFAATDISTHAVDIVSGRGGVWRMYVCITALQKRML